jgi:hypothetical protein
MDFGDQSGVPVQPVARSATELAALFKDVCLSSEDNFRNSLVGNAHELTAAPVTVNTEWGRVSLDIWRGKGAVLSRSQGFYAAQFPQCNVLFYLDQPLRSVEGVEAVSLALAGVRPSKSTVSKRYPVYRSEWNIALAGMPAVVSTQVWQPSESASGSRVFMSVRKTKNHRRR